MQNRILLAGDFVPRTDSKPYDPFSGEIKDLFRGSEYVMINLETPLTERGKPILKTGKNFRRNPQYAEILKKAGVDCVCLANNHIRDFGDEGVLDTIRYCIEAGLDIVGAGFNSEDAAKPLIKELGSVKVAFLNYCEREFSIADKNQAGANPFDLIDAYHAIQDLRSEVDKVIVIYHGGIEYQHYPTREMMKKFRFLVENGADAVFVHHAHAYSGYEVYRGNLIQYGLGNLFAASRSNNMGDDWLTGLVFEYKLCRSRNNHDKVVYYYVKMKPDYSAVDIVNESEVKKIIPILNEIISNPDKLHAAWDDTKSRFLDYYLAILSSNSKLGYSINKHLFKNFKSMSQYRKKILINCMRCDSIRNFVIDILCTND